MECGGVCVCVCVCVSNTGGVRPCLGLFETCFRATNKVIPHLFEVRMFARNEVLNGACVCVCVCVCGVCQARQARGRASMEC